MKYFLVCASLVLGAISIQAKPHHNKKEQLAEYKKECLEKSGVSPDVAEKTKEGVFPNDPLLKEYQFCFSQKLGYQDSNGKINRDAFLSKLRRMTKGDEELCKKLEKCAVESSSPQETAYQVSLCLYDQSPPYFKFNWFNPVSGHLSKETYEKLSNYRKECTNETGVEDEFVKNAHLKGELADDPKFKEYLYCYSKKVGFQNEEGELQIDMYKTKIMEIISDETLVNKIGEACFIQKGTPQETAFSLFKCIIDTSPIRIDLFPKYGKRCGMRKHVRKCIKETGVDVSLIRMAKQGQFKDDMKLKEYYFCLAKRIGAVLQDGEVDFDAVKEKSSKLFKDPIMANELVDKCLMKKETPLETIFQAVQCYSKNSPEHMDIFQPIPEEVKQRVMADVKYCSAMFPVPKEIVEKSRKGDFVDDKQLKNYFFCINKRADVQYDDGRINVGVVRRHLHHALLDDETEEIMAKCVIMQEMPENTAFEMFKCIHAYAPEFSTVILLDS